MHMNESKIAFNEIVTSNDMMKKTLHELICERSTTEISALLQAYAKHKKIDETDVGDTISDEDILQNFYCSNEALSTRFGLGDGIAQFEDDAKETLEEHPLLTSDEVADLYLTNMTPCGIHDNNLLVVLDCEQFALERDSRIDSIRKEEATRDAYQDKYQTITSKLSQFSGCCSELEQHEAKSAHVFRRFFSDHPDSHKEKPCFINWTTDDDNSFYGFIEPNHMTLIGAIDWLKSNNVDVSELSNHLDIEITIKG